MMRGRSCWRSLGHWVSGTGTGLTQWFYSVVLPFFEGVRNFIWWRWQRATKPHCLSEFDAVGDKSTVFERGKTYPGCTVVSGEEHTADFGGVFSGAHSHTLGLP
jgi:hypothetical protein